MERTTHIPGMPLAPTEDQTLNEVERLTAQLASERAAHAVTLRQLDLAREARPQGAELTTYEPQTEHGRAAVAASQHLHLTADECLRAGVSRTVLTKTGWFVPPVLRSN